MTTGWLFLLLLLIIPSHRVDSQSTTDDETCSGDGGLLSKLQSDMQRLLDNQQQILQQHQTIMNRLGKFLFTTTLARR